MKFVAIAALCLGLAAAPALAQEASSSSSLASIAPPRDVVEANLAARMRFAKASLSQGFEELKAGDKVKGCADLKAGAEDLGVARDLLVQDIDLMKIDPSIPDQAQRDSLAAQAQDNLTHMTATRDKIAAIIQQQCS
jgi:hypothetical protein